MWHEGNRGGAVAMWIEAGDAGNGVAAYNAGMALLKDRNLPFGDTSPEERLKIAVRMFKCAKIAGLGGPEQAPVDDRIGEAYAAIGRIEKMRKVLGEEGKTALACYLLGVSELRETGWVDLGLVVGSLARATGVDPRFGLVGFAVLPQIVGVFVRQVSAGVWGRCTGEEWGRLVAAVSAGFAATANLWAPIVVALGLVVFVRLRLTVAFNSPRSWAGGAVAL
jgi:hypothetical protein